jgi:hypothetical protein
MSAPAPASASASSPQKKRKVDQTEKEQDHQKVSSEPIAKDKKYDHYLVIGYDYRKDNQVKVLKIFSTLIEAKTFVDKYTNRSQIEDKREYWVQIEGDVLYDKPMFSATEDPLNSEEDDDDEKRDARYEEDEKREKQIHDEIGWKPEFQPRMAVVGL